MQALLHKIPRNTAFTCVGLGALVITNTNSYFISVSAGETTHENEKVYCISPATPIGKLLMGKQEGDSFRFQSKDTTLLTVI
jgi:transcription elongation GreA/GreB family factor